MWHIERIYRITKQTQTGQEPSKKVCRLKSFHLNCYCCGTSEVTVKSLNASEAEQRDE